MKERCGHMQKVNDLCKEVENDKGSLTSSPERRISFTETGEIPELTAEEEENDEDDTLPKESSPPSSPYLDPKLIELAMEVKDLNVRFAATCMQAKQHYASLSRVLTASMQRQSAMSSTSSVRRHKKKDSSASGSPRTFPRRSRRVSDGDHEEYHKKRGKMHRQINGGKSLDLELDVDDKTDSINKDTENHSNIEQDLPDRKQGVVHIPEASVLAADSPTSARLQHNLSLSGGTDLDKELFLGAGTAHGDRKASLRCRSISCEEYSDFDFQHRQKRRPISALVTQSNLDGGTEQLQNGGNRRNSVCLGQEECSGLTTSQDSAQLNPPSSAVSARTRYKSSRTKFGSVSTLLEPRDRSSFVSTNSLDPIIMLGRDMKHGQFHQSFEASTSSDIACSTAQIPDSVRKQGFGVWSGIVGMDNGLCVSKQSMSMDNLAFQNQKEKGLCVHNYVKEFKKFIFTFSTHSLSCHKLLFMATS